MVEQDKPSLGFIIFVDSWRKKHSKSDVKGLLLFKQEKKT